MYVRSGYRLSSLDMGTCARICRLSAILGRGAQARAQLGLGLGLGFRGAGVDTHVNILGGTAYMLELDIDYQP